MVLATAAAPTTRRAITRSRSNTARYWVQRPTPRELFQPVRRRICDGHTECFVGYVDSAAKEDSEQPGGPPASHRVLRGVENGGNPTETARDATKNASGSGDGTSVVAVGRATFGHLRPPSASRNSRVPAIDALPALLSCQMPAHHGYTAPVFAKTRMVCVLLHSRNFAY